MCECVCVRFNQRRKAADLFCRDCEEDCVRKKSLSARKTKISLQLSEGMVKVKRQTLRTEREEDKGNGEEEENNRKEQAIKEEI